MSRTEEQQAEDILQEIREEVNRQLRDRQIEQEGIVSQISREEYPPADLPPFPGLDPHFLSGYFKKPKYNYSVEKVIDFAERVTNLNKFGKDITEITELFIEEILKTNK
ncbi:MAG: hypothetical protein E6Q36_08595 [Chryseobacterium sp.]|nr:MAG: hypothetical protein E6Q36_08595 [Chryseobacterium sp.]